MILVVIPHPQPGHLPRLVAFADHACFEMFVSSYKSDYSVQFIEDGEDFVDKLYCDERSSENS